MAPKLKNKALTREECTTYAERMTAREADAEKMIAREAAVMALMGWYRRAFFCADAEVPKVQIDYNLSVVGSIPGWQNDKGVKNGFVMLTTVFDATPKPLIIRLDYETKPTGGLTGRQLHLQVRKELGLEPKVSLRMCPFRPWYRHFKNSFPVPEAEAIPARDSQCTALLGTTILYYTYVHLRDVPSVESVRR